MSFGSSKSSNDNRFSRSGTASTTTFRDLLPEHIELFRQALDSVSPGSASAAVNDRLASEIGQYSSTAPYQAELASYIQSVLPGSGYGGQSNLTAQANVNPYDSSYDTNTFDRYATDVGAAMAQARSGPMMNRGGTAANGYMQAQALNDLSLDRERVLQGNRQADSAISQGAATSLNDINNKRMLVGLQGVTTGQQDHYQNRSSGLSAIDKSQRASGMFGELVPSFATMNSPVYGSEANDLTGAGSQTSSSMGVSGGCCWIFLEGYHGNMPGSVRMYRDLFAGEDTDRRNGYRKMAGWLVPLMRTSERARGLVWRLMVKPLTEFGESYFKMEKPKLSSRLARKFWFTTWNLIGNFTK